MHVIFMGPQGVGKGTQAAIVAEKLGLTHVSTGDLFRAAIKAQTPLGVMAKEILDKGEFCNTNLRSAPCLITYTLKGEGAERYRGITPAQAVEAIGHVVGIDDAGHGDHRHRHGQQ